MDFILRNNVEREVFCEYMQSLPEDKIYDVSIKLHREKRTNPQNAWYWTIVGIVAKETQNDKESIHKFFARKFIGFDVKEFGGEKIGIVRSTASLNTEEFSDFLSNVEAFCASELGIILPDPSSKIYEMITRNE